MILAAPQAHTRQIKKLGSLPLQKNKAVRLPLLKKKKCLAWLA